MARVPARGTLLSERECSKPKKIIGFSVNNRMLLGRKKKKKKNGYQ